MNRYRLVTRTTARGKTEEHVSSVILTEQEALDDIEVEESLARAAGWQTVKLEAVGRPHPILVCNRGRLVRSITVRESSWDTDLIA